MRFSGGFGGTAKTVDVNTVAAMTTAKIAASKGS